MIQSVLKPARTLLFLAAASVIVAGCQTTGTATVGVTYYDSLLWNDYYHGYPRPPKPERPKPEQPIVRPPNVRPPVARPPVVRPPIHRPPVARPMPARR